MRSSETARTLGRLQALAVLFALVTLVPASTCQEQKKEAAAICWTSADCLPGQTCWANGAVEQEQVPIDCGGNRAACQVTQPNDTEGGVFGPGDPRCSCGSGQTAGVSCDVPCGGHCIGSEECGSNADCKMGVCINGRCAPGCVTAADCAGGQICQVPKSDVAFCSAVRGCTDPSAPPECYAVCDVFTNECYLSTWTTGQAGVLRSACMTATQGDYCGMPGALGNCFGGVCMPGRHIGIDCPSGFAKSASGLCIQSAAVVADAGDACPYLSASQSCPPGSEEADLQALDYQCANGLCPCHQAVCVSIVSSRGCSLGNLCPNGFVCSTDPGNPSRNICIPIQSCSDSQPCPGGGDGGPSAFSCVYPNAPGFAGGTCVPSCTQDPDCSVGACQNGTCGPMKCGAVYPGGRFCQADGECPLGQTCQAVGVCAVSCDGSGGSCPTGSTCQLGVCVATSGCPSGQVCGTGPTFGDASIIECVPAPDSGGDSGVDATMNDATMEASSDSPEDVTMDVTMNDAPADVGSEASSDGGDAGGDAGDGAIVCNALTNTAPQVSVVDILGSPPSPAGGTITPGTYFLTQVAYYYAAEGGGGVSGTYQATANVTKISADAIESLPNQPPDQTFTRSWFANGNYLVISDLCNFAPDLFVNGSDGYTASPTQLVLFFTINNVGYVDTWTRQ